MNTPPAPPAAALRSGLCQANGTTLHYELRGDGPSLLLIAGASGDASAFDAVADALASDFTVVAYDRRGRSRSPRPPGWTRTSLDEQADDAAALLRALDLAPAHVFGPSSGATIGLNLVLRHPGTVRSAVLHEPPKIGVLPDRDRFLAALRARMDTARAAGGHRAAMADFLGWLTGPEQADTDPGARAARERVLDHADVWLDLELGVVDRYDALNGTARMPVTIAVGSEGATALHQERLDDYRAALQALALRAGARLCPMAGAHVPYRSDPQRFVRELRALLA